MPTPLRVSTRVLEGNRIEISDPALRVGDDVEVVVLPARKEGSNGIGVADFLRTLQPSTRTPQEWDALEHEFHSERDAWER